MGYGFSRLLNDLNERKQDAYIELQRQEYASNGEVPTKSHHEFTGVPYHHLMGEQLGTARFGVGIDAEHEQVV
jgi:hypothetical protein